MPEINTHLDSDETSAKAQAFAALNEAHEKIKDDVPPEALSLTLLPKQVRVLLDESRPLPGQDYAVNVEFLTQRLSEEAQNNPTDVMAQERLKISRRFERLPSNPQGCEQARQAIDTALASLKESRATYERTHPYDSNNSPAITLYKKVEGTFTKLWDEINDREQLLRDRGECYEASTILNYQEALPESTFDFNLALLRKIEKNLSEKTLRAIHLVTVNPDGTYTSSPTPASLDEVRAAFVAHAGEPVQSIQQTSREKSNSEEAVYKTIIRWESGASSVFEMHVATRWARGSGNVESTDPLFIPKHQYHAGYKEWEKLRALERGIVLDRHELALHKKRNEQRHRLRKTYDQLVPSSELTTADLEHHIPEFPLTINEEMFDSNGWVKTQEIYPLHREVKPEYQRYGIRLLGVYKPRYSGNARLIIEFEPGFQIADYSPTKPSYEHTYMLAHSTLGRVDRLDPEDESIGLGKSPTGSQWEKTWQFSIPFPRYSDQETILHLQTFDDLPLFITLSNRSEANRTDGANFVLSLQNPALIELLTEMREDLVPTDSRAASEITAYQVAYRQATEHIKTRLRNKEITLSDAEAALFEEFRAIKQRIHLLMDWEEYPNFIKLPGEEEQTESGKPRVQRPNSTIEEIIEQVYEQKVGRRLTESRAAYEREKNLRKAEVVEVSSKTTGQRRAESQLIAAGDENEMERLKTTISLLSQERVYLQSFMHVIAHHAQFALDLDQKRSRFPRRNSDSREIRNRTEKAELSEYQIFEELFLLPRDEFIRRLYELSKDQPLPDQKPVPLFSRLRYHFTGKELYRQGRRFSAQPQLETFLKKSEVKFILEIFDRYAAEVITENQKLATNAVFSAAESVLFIENPARLERARRTLEITDETTDGEINPNALAEMDESQRVTLERLLEEQNQ